MSDGFLGRWSRRKRAAHIETPLAEPAPAVPEIPDAALPPVESLDAASDYTAFLQKGVSAVTQQQALRRAWESDAAIASFRGMADYDWDFNAPAYGRLWPTDDVAKLLRNVLASPPEPEAEIEASPVPLAEPVVADAETGSTPVPDVAGLEHAEIVLEAAPPPRRHGTALPC